MPLDLYIELGCQYEVPLLKREHQYIYFNWITLSQFINQLASFTITYSVKSHDSDNHVVKCNRLIERICLVFKFLLKCFQA